MRKEEAASDIEEQQKLVDAGVDPRGVTFVPVNFELQNWVDELCKHGFKLATPTLVLWEGVTMYLTPAAVDACMKDFQRLAPTSVIAFEYWLKLSDETKDFNGVGKPDQPSTALQKAVQILFGSIIGESFNFGLDEGAHVEWMKKYGFDIVDHLTHTEMDKKWNSIHGKTFFENANVPRLIKVELPKKSRLSFGR